MKTPTYLLLFLLSTALILPSCKKEEANTPEACFVVSEERKTGVPINFSSSCSINASSYHWDFGDGQSSEEAYPSHTYSEEGDYAVTLSVKNEAGDSDEITHIIFVEGPV